jgi:predicted acylesterase/phospholipase RssA
MLVDCPNWISQVEYLVFSGGGMRGLLVSGALSVLENVLEKKLLGCGGSSIGALIAMMVVVGYDSKEMQHQFARDADFMRANNDVLSLTTKYGLNNKTGLVSRLKELLTLKKIDPDITFGQLRLLTNKLLRVTVTNLATEESEIWDACTTPDRCVWEGVATSMALPIICCPTIAQGLVEQQYLVDGGVLDNLPLTMFDQEKTLAIWLPYQSSPIKSFTGYLQCVLSVTWKALQKAQYAALSASWKKRIVALSIDESVSVLDVDLPWSKRREMIEQGAIQMCGFLKRDKLVLQYVEILLHVLVIVSLVPSTKKRDDVNKTVTREDSLKIKCCSSHAMGQGDENLDHDSWISPVVEISDSIEQCKSQTQSLQLKSPKVTNLFESIPASILRVRVASDSLCSLCLYSKKYIHQPQSTLMDEEAREEDNYTKAVEEVLAS